MSELGWIDYTLPSRGVLYGNKLPGGRVSLRPMTAKQQALLQTQGGGVTGKLDALMETCCKLPEGFRHADLLLTDRLAALIALRTKTFGSEYTFEWKCRYCGAFNRAKIDIVKELEERPASKDLKEPIEVVLRDADVIVEARFLRGSDEEVLLRNARRLQMQSNDADDPSYLMRVAMQLVSKGGEQFKDILDKRKFVENLSAGDLVAFEDEVNAREPGIDLRLYPECPKCQAPNEMVMPFQGEFFRPRSRRG